MKTVVAVLLSVALAAGCAGTKDAPQTEQLKVDPALLLAAPLPAADGVTLAKDLTSVIALLGLPCGEVISARQQADNDHIASCKDGNRYRVFVSAEGRAVAQKQ